MAVDTARKRAQRGRKHAPRKTRTKRKGFFRRYWWVFVAVPMVGFLSVAGALFYVYAHLELPATPPPLQTTYIYDADGNVISTLHATIDRTIIPFSDMPKTLRNAVIATEDKGFYSHGGIDPVGILRAAWNDLVSHQVVQGGSTITQQLVKNVYAGHYVTDPDSDVTSYVVPPRTFGQKIREGLLAVKLEQTYSKDEILTKYLNTIYFGHGAYGVQAAAQTYWSEDAKDLTPLESATLAGAITSPSAFDPITNPADSQVRRNFVLDRMVATGALDAARAAQLKAKPVRTTPADVQAQLPPKLGYFLDYTKRNLIAKYGEAAVFGGGLQVTTTLDQTLQHAAEQAVKAHLSTPGDPSGALVAIDPRTGGVLAMVGGNNFQKSEVNLATGDGGTGRQSGSAFKTFTLTAAMEDRISLSSRWYGPSPITIKDPRCYTDGAPWTLSNASDSESGTFTLEQATEHSVNTVFAQVVTVVGPDAVVDVAHRMGIETPLQPVCSITLGTQEVTPLDMTDAYATLAARGWRHKASPLADVTDTVESFHDTINTRGKQVLDTNDADLVTSALQTVVIGGTGTNARLSDRPVAGKTGTTQNYVDAWFCGYTPQLATCVWVGYPQGQISMTNIEGYSAVFGGTIPALIWHDFMTEALAGRPVLDFHEPSLEGYTAGPPTPVPAPRRASRRRWNPRRARRRPRHPRHPRRLRRAPARARAHRLRPAPARHPRRAQRRLPRRRRSGKRGNRRRDRRTRGSRCSPPCAGDGVAQASLTASSRSAGTASSGSVASTMVPLPGVE